MLVVGRRAVVAVLAAGRWVVVVAVVAEGRCVVAAAVVAGRWAVAAVASNVFPSLRVRPETVAGDEDTRSKRGV